MKRTLLTVAIAVLLAPAGSAQDAGSALKLEDLEQRALQNNPTISQAQAEIRAAAGRIRQASLYPNPTVGYKGDEIRGGAFRGGEQGFSVSQNIVLGGKLRAARKIAQTENTQANISLEEQRYRVLHTVRTLFYQALAAQEMVALRRQLSELANDAVKTSQQLANVGQADESDLLQAEVEGQQAALETIGAEQDERRIWSQLAAAVGKPDLKRGHLEANLEDIPQIEPEQILLNVLNESPSVKQAQAGVSRSEAALVWARKSPIPDLQLRAGLQQDRELGELSRHSVGLVGFAEAGMQIPIFNRNQGNIQTAQAELERARHEVTRVQLQIRLQFAPAAQQYLTSRSMVESYKRDILPKAQKAYDLYRKKYQQMQAAYPQVLIAQRTLFHLQIAYLRALESAWTSSVTMKGFLLNDGLSSAGTMGERRAAEQ